MWRSIRRAFSGREIINCDVAIVGAGPAGLSAAIKLKQINPDFEVCVLEKAAEVGAHIVSGNCFEPRALDELIPNWRELDTPIKTPVTEDEFYILNETRGFKIPQAFVPKTLYNHGNYVISLSDTVRWLGKYAENLGVNILPGFAGAEYLLNPEGYIEGVATGEVGIGKDGKKKENYQQGIEIRAKQTMIAEGCRGSLSGLLQKKFNLNSYFDGERHIKPQTYGIGIKEVWKVDYSKLTPGLVMHSVNWPLDTSTQGGGFLYHEMPGFIHLGLIIGLDYKNPYLNPYKEFQRYKTHPIIKRHIQDGECISYGARAVNEGGFNSVPKLTFPGGMLIGCSAGFLNPAKIKGTHTAMKSGILAAETVADALIREDAEGKELFKYTEKYKNSWIWEELHQVRSVREGFRKNLWVGLAHAFISYNFLGGGSAMLGKSSHKSDSESTGLARDHKPIEYPKPDGTLTFDLLTNLSRTGTNHNSDQPPHLKIKPGMQDTPSEYSLPVYAAPEQRFCPAGVYEYVDNKLQINAQNCIHCKTCDIKTPAEYIQWVPPEGSGGPF